MLGSVGAADYDMGRTWRELGCACTKPAPSLHCWTACQPCWAVQPALHCIPNCSFCVFPASSRPSPAVLHGFLASDASAARMRVDLRSRELLATWVALCLVHRATCAAHPLLQEYGVGVRWQDLRHLVLSDCAACEALRGVAAYLRQHTREGRAVFTLRDGGKATFAQAAAFGQRSPELQRIWREEQATAARRKEAHWAEVWRKQTLAAQLRAELEEKKSAEAAAERARQEAYGIYDSSRVNRQRRSLCDTVLHNARLARSRTEARLAATLESPEPVIQPLPQGQATAAQWLFFLYMPDLFRWGAVAFDGQQATPKAPTTFTMRHEISGGSHFACLAFWLPESPTPAPAAAAPTLPCAGSSPASPSWRSRCCCPAVRRPRLRW